MKKQEDPRNKTSDKKFFFCTTEAAMGHILEAAYRPSENQIAVKLKMDDGEIATLLLDRSKVLFGDGKSCEEVPESDSNCAMEGYARYINESRGKLLGSITLDRWRTIAKKAFEQRDEAKRKLREAEEKLDEVQKKVAAGEEISAMERALTIDLSIANLITMEGDAANELFALHVFLAEFEQIEAANKMVVRIDAPAKAFKTFRHWGQSVFCPSTSRLVAQEGEMGVLAVPYGIPVHLNNRIKSEGIEEPVLRFYLGKIPFKKHEFVQEQP